MLDGIELAHRTIITAEVASMAAASAAQGLKEPKNKSSSPSSDEKARHRLLPRPNIFSPEHREAELSQ